MISKLALKIAADVITGKRRNMKDLAGNANAHKMGLKNYEADYIEYQLLSEVLRAIEAEIAQERLEI